MGIRISKDHLHPSVIESITSLIGDLSQLETTAKGNAVEAINELLANGGSKEELEALIAEIAQGKELIANAVGEPLTAEDSFNEMSNDINGLLSTFKTNMMNNGVTVESSDRFKSLIDKIATLADSEGKGIQYAEGSGSITFKSTTVDGYLAYQTFQIAMLDFTPNIVFVEFNAFSNVPSFIILSTNCTQDSPHILEYSSVNSYSHKIYLTVNGGSISVSVLTPTNSNTTATLNYYAIGVGEEDTTLRDSLASILQGEGVEVTPEDDMSSLITKVDNEFNNRPLPSLGDLSGVNHDFLFDISASGSTATVVSGYSIQLTGDYELVFDWSGPSVNAIRVGYVNIFKNDVSIKQYTLNGTRDGTYTFTFSAVKGDILKITITGEGYSSSVSNLRLRGNLIF